MASRDPEPPAYSDCASASQGPESADPPTYDAVADSLPREQLVAGELPCLVMDDCLIYAEPQSDRPLYELSNPPTANSARVYGIEKFMYRFSTADGEGTMRQRKRHIYDFRNTSEVGVSVSLEPKVNSKVALKGTGLMTTITQSWSSCKVADHFKAEQNMKQRLGHRDQLDWKNMRGKVIAVETKPTRKQDGSVDRLPKLEIKASLDVKEFDLLVTTWTARLWKESQKDLEEPFGWSRFKRIASVSTGPNSTRLSYGGAVR